MLAQEKIDYYDIFEINPTAMALLDADLVFLDANDQFLEAVGRPLDKLVGHNAFEEFPKMPDDPENPKRTALEAALASGRPEVLHLTRYDIEDPSNPGVFEERYWSSVVTPLLGADGEVKVLELSVREVTSIIAECRASLAQWQG